MFAVKLFKHCRVVWQSFSAKYIKLSIHAGENGSNIHDSSVHTLDHEMSFHRPFLAFLGCKCPSKIHDVITCRVLGHQGMYKTFLTSLCILQLPSSLTVTPHTHRHPPKNVNLIWQILSKFKEITLRRTHFFQDIFDSRDFFFLFSAWFESKNFGNGVFVWKCSWHLLSIFNNSG